MLHEAWKAGGHGGIFDFVFGVIPCRLHFKCKAFVFHFEFQANVSRYSLLKPIKKILFDSTNLTDEHELQVVPVRCHPWSGSHYKLQLLGEDAEEVRRNLHARADVAQSKEACNDCCHSLLCRL